MVGVTGFEPATSSSRTKRATKLRYTPKINFGANDGARTHDLQFTKLLLCLLSYIGTLRSRRVLLYHIKIKIAIAFFLIN